MKTTTLSTANRPTVARAPRPAVLRRSPAAVSAGAADAVRRALQAGRTLQPTLALDTPGDAYEREAERSAAHIAAGQPAPRIARLSGPPRLSDEPTKSAQRLPAAVDKDDTRRKPPPAQRKAAPSGGSQPQPAAAPPRPADEELRRVQRARRDDDARRRLQRSLAAGTATPTGLDAAERAIATRGAGQPLPAPVRQRLEAGLGADLSDVRVHSDASAQSAAQAIGARAFTHGRGIWLGRGETATDLRLMAHEATHVLQQDAGLVQRVADRAATPSAPASAPACGPATGPPAVQRAAAPTAGAAYQSPAGLYPVAKLYLPKIKHRLLPQYNAWGALDRLKNYERGSPNQQDKWLAGDQVKLPAAKLKPLGIDLAQDKTTPVAVKLGSQSFDLGASDDLVKQLKIPIWTKKRTLVDKNHGFEVDHQVELQVSGWPANTRANSFDNYELLDRESNGTSGGDVWRALRVSIAAQMEADGLMPGNASVDTRKDKVRALIASRGAHFAQAVPDAWPNKLYEPKGDALAAGSQFWSKAEIEAGAHLDLLTRAQALGEAGDASRYAVLAPSRTAKLFQVPQSGAVAQTVEVPTEQRQAVDGLTLLNVSLNAGRTQAKAGQSVGMLRVRLDAAPEALPDKPELNVPLLRHEAHSAYLGLLPAGLKGVFKGMSPVEFGHVGIAERQLVAQGRLTPTLPLLGATPIEITLRGRDIEFAHTFEAEDLRLPVPGLTIDQSTLTIGAGSAGLRADGQIGFSIAGAGSGVLTARFNSRREFEAGGSFSFDTRLFDRATIDVWYRRSGDGAASFGGQGALGIDTPGRVRGIRSAEATVRLERGHIDATGRLQPQLPAVEQATLGLHQAPGESLRIDGTLQLGQGAPGLRSGQMGFELQQSEAGWRLRGSGQAEPAIPGLTARVALAWDDGVFDARGQGGFHHGMLGGQVDIGVTNRALGPDGRPQREGAAAAAPLVVYGGGQVDLQVAPWLRAGVGLRFEPDGRVGVSGELALPDRLPLFDRIQFDRPLLDVALQVPIVPGVVAEVGGSLSAQAGAGPGLVEHARLQVDYSPAHEERTHVRGEGQVRVPADAGLQLRLRAGIGLGVTGLSATGGLQIGGLAGVAGAATAAAQIDWRPGRGLVIDAEAGVSAQPRFVFTIAGYVNARVLGASLYDRTFDLAAYEFGSALRVGVYFPVHWAEGQPFTLDPGRVRFDVPPVDPRQLVAGLIRQVAA